MLAAAILAGCVTTPVPPTPPPRRARRRHRPFHSCFASTPYHPASSKGGRKAIHAAPCRRSSRSCAALAARPDDAPLGGVNYAGTAGEWRQVCVTAAQVSVDDPDAVRGFFESEFVPYRVAQGSGAGLFTGYYEPQLKGSRTRHGPYQTPLYGVPVDLVNVDLGLFRDNLRGQRIVGKVADGRLMPYPARAEIEVAGPAGAAPILFVDDPIDAFFLQIQGSGRVVLDDGTVVRAAYAAQNGRPYTPIGAILIQRGELKPRDGLDAVDTRLASRASRRSSSADERERVLRVLHRAADRRPVIGSARRPGRAADTGSEPCRRSHRARARHSGLARDDSAPDPDTAKPDQRFHRLLVMQDTGGAIRGPVRGDVYWGYSPDAGSIAGRMRSEGRMTVLLPRSVAARLGPNAEFAGPLSGDAPRVR